MAKPEDLKLMSAMKDLHWALNSYVRFIPAINDLLLILAKAEV